MNKLNKYFFLSAAALAGMASFTSCSSDDSSDAAANNGAGTDLGVVKTQFAINVPYAKGAGTRMTEANTQGENKNFLGISNISLLSIKNPTNAVLSNTTKVEGNENLGTDKDAYSTDSKTTGGNFRSLYRDVTIPVETTDFIFYGSATNSDGTSEDAKFAHGVLDATNVSTKGQLSEQKFALKPIAVNANFSTNENAKHILQGLNAILNSAIPNPTSGGDSIKWSTVGTDTPENKVLNDRYTRFIGLTSGSANAVRLTIEELKKQLGTPDAASKPLTAKIVENCDAALTLIGQSTTFPTDLNLPEGAAHLSYNQSKNVFSYVASNANALGQNAIDYTKITYPASLSYFVKTKAMVSDNELTSLNGLPTYEDWTKNPTTAWSKSGINFKESAVTAKTRAVALKDAIQYGVANLKLSVKCGNTSLEDNQEVINGNANQNIGVDDTAFELKGVLVGGQPQSVGWNFEPNTEDFNYTIYDKSINTTDDHFYVTTNTGNQYNYTLVLDNNQSTQAEKVYVTLELLNNAADFYGVNGFIPKNSVFYLVGELNWSSVKDNVTTGVTHIFTQDHTTIANFTIGSLKNAYNCIPDLRSSKISVGLAVDLQWREGVTFNYTIE